MAWSIDKGGTHAGDRHMQMRLIMKEVDGTPMSAKVNPAPPREALTCFGGELDIKTFRKGAEVAKTCGSLKAFIPHEFELLVEAGFEMKRPYSVVSRQNRRSNRLGSTVAPQTTQ